MVKPDNYILIYGWMVNDLKLKGNELLLYAMIYGFSQDGETEFSGSLRYMQEWLGAGSKHTVLSVIEKLISKGLIKKRTAIEKGVKRSFYMAVPRGGAKTAPVDGAETALGWCKNCTADGAETAPNNIEDILVIKDDDEERARDPRLDQELSRIIQAYQANIGTFPPAAVDELQRWRQIFSTEMLLLSIEEAAKTMRTPGGISARYLPTGSRSTFLPPETIKPDSSVEHLRSSPAVRRRKITTNFLGNISENRNDNSKNHRVVDAGRQLLRKTAHF